MISLASVAAMLASACGVAGAWVGLAELEQRLRTGDDRQRMRRLVSGHGAGRDAMVLYASLIAAAWVSAGVVVATCSVVLLPLLARMLRTRAAAKRERQLSLSLPVVARTLADSLSAGHPLAAALEAAASVTPGPAAVELGRCVAERDLGMPLGASLDALGARLRDPGWRSLSCAMSLMHDLGGDLAGLLRRLAAAREEQLRGEAQAAAALTQVRSTARLVAGVPALTAVAAELLAPGTFARALGQPASAVLLVISLGLSVLAAVLLALIARTVTGR